MARRSRFLRRKIKKIRRAFVRRNWWILALLALWIVVVFVAVTGFQIWNLRGRIDPGLILAFHLGLGIATLIAVLLTALGLDGARHQRQGLAAERWTAEILGRLRRQGWWTRHDVEFDKMNIDHVMIGLQGAIAVETKYRDAVWSIGESAIEEAQWSGRALQITEPVRQAKDNAFKLRSLLRAAGVRTEVLPVLVLWGPRLSGKPTAEIDGVLVVAGRHKTLWTNRLIAQPLSIAEVRAAKKALRLLGKEWVMTPPGESPAPISAPPLSDPGDEKEDEPSKLSGVLVPGDPFG